MPWICIYCKKENEDDGDACDYCGASISLATSALPLNDQPPEMLVDRYKFCYMLKSGGMGRVFKAYDTQRDEYVAIKEMRLKINDPGEKKYAQEKFMEEVRVLGKLSHPGLPIILDFFVTRDSVSGGVNHFLVETFIEGKDLETIMEERNHKPLPTAQALNYMIQILEILTYLHQENFLIFYHHV